MTDKLLAKEAAGKPAAAFVLLRVLRTQLSD
jgi:hypothetical protein